MNLLDSSITIVVVIVVVCGVVQLLLYLFGTRLKVILYLCRVLYTFQMTAILIICCYSATNGNCHHNIRSMVDFVVISHVSWCCFCLCCLFVLHLFYWLFFRSSFIINY